MHRSRLSKFAVCAVLVMLIALTVFAASAAVSFYRPSYSVGLNQKTVLPVKNGTPVKWETSNAKIFTVDETGLISGHKTGTAKIRVTSEDGTSAIATLRVVAKNKGVTAFAISASKKTVVAGKTFTLKCKYKPSYPTDRSVKWYTSDSKIAAVNSSGKVKGVRPGTAVITAVSSSGIIAECRVTVTPVAVSKISLNRTSVTVNYGASGTLKATIKPSNATDKSVKWESSNTNVATVVNGKVKTTGLGTATIKATSSNGKVALCKIKVNPIKVKKVKLNRTTGKLDMGKTGQLKASLTPTNATDKTVVWKSSNPGIASVDETGLVKGEAPGTATITALAQNGTVKATCKITVSGNTTLVRAKELINNIALNPKKSGYAPLDAKIESLFAELFTEDMDTYDMVKAVFDYMVTSNTYLRDHSYPGIKGYSNERQAKALYILTYNKGNCHDYSSAFMYMMNAIGINCSVQYGKTSALAGGWTGHYWNNIVINGVEYIFDCQVEKNAMKGNTITYTRFCKTYPEMSNKYKKG